MRQLADADEAVALGSAGTGASSPSDVLIHGYADVDDRLVWDVVETSLPALVQEIALLLNDRRTAPPEPA